MAATTIATIPPKGNNGAQWQYRVKTSTGITQVSLKNLAPKRSGEFQVQVKAKGWFDGPLLNGLASDTTLTVTIGGNCLSHGATKLNP